MNRRALMLLIALVLIWGGNWPILKIALLYLSPLWLVALRLGLGTLCLFVWVALVERRVPLPRRSELPLVFSVGLLQLAAFSILINLGLRHVEAGRSAILSYTTPLWVAPAAVLVLGERLRPAQIGGLVLGLAGVAVLFNPLTFDWADPDQRLGNLCLMLGALAWACGIIHVRAHRWRSSQLVLAPWQMLVGLVPTTLLALLVEGPPQPRWGWELAGAVLYTGTLATAFAFWAAITVARAVPALTAALAFLAVPVFGLACSAVALGEPLTLPTLAGFGLILAGVATVTVAGNRT